MERTLFSELLVIKITNSISSDSENLELLEEDFEKQTKCQFNVMGVVVFFIFLWKSCEIEVMLWYLV